MSKSRLLQAALAVLCVTLTFRVLSAERSMSWEAIEHAARGQTVYFNAWAGDDAINEFGARGEVWLEGRDITALAPQRRGVGILFQDDLLFPHLNVGGNLAFGLHASERSRSARTRRIEEALESMGLEGFAGRDPATLSGGQRARVGLLRVLLSRPKALLLDEPFAHLDRRTRADVRQLVFDEVRRRSLPTLLVTHDVEDVRVTGGAYLELKPDSGGEECSRPAYSP